MEEAVQKIFGQSFFVILNFMYSLPYLKIYDVKRLITNLIIEVSDFFIVSKW